MNALTTFFSAGVAIILGVGLGMVSSHWIDRLYARSPRALLSYPDAVERRGRFRPSGMAGMMAMTFCWTLLQTKAGREPLTAVFMFIFLTFMWICTFTDFEQQVIYNKVLTPFALLGIINTFAMGYEFSDRLEAAVVGGLVFLAISVITHGGIGGGDVKLIAALGLWVGTDMLTVIAICGILLGGLAALVMMLTKKKKRHEYFAYGPYFTITAIFLVLI